MSRRLFRQLLQHRGLVDTSPANTSIRNRWRYIFIVPFVVVLSSIGIGSAIRTDSPAKNATQKSNNLELDISKDSSTRHIEGQAIHHQSTSDVSVSSNESGANVTINGQSEPVTPNQPLSRTYQSDDGSTQVDVQVEHNSSNTNNHQQIQLNVQSRSSSSSQGNTAE